MLVLSAGLRRAMPAQMLASTWGPRLVSGYAVGLIGAGLFVTDSISERSADMPAPIEPNVQGILHNVFSMVVFGALAGACGVFTRRFAQAGNRGWAAYSALSGVLIVSGVQLAEAVERQAGDLAAMRHAPPRARLVYAAGSVRP